MNVTLVFRDDARADLDGAADWYKARKPRLEVALVAEVQKIFGEISVHPDRYPVAAGSTRQAPVPGFPYCDYYRVRGDRVTVTAILHTSRNPSVWRRQN